MSKPDNPVVIAVHKINCLGAQRINASTSSREALVKIFPNGAQEVSCDALRDGRLCHLPHNTAQPCVHFRNGSS